MELKELIKRPEIAQNKKLTNAFNQLEKLLIELKKKELPNNIINTINSEIDQVNSVSQSEKELKKQLVKAQNAILKLVEKELKYVSKNHYRNLWLVLGMAVFGVPFGAAFGASTGNMGLLGIGLPLGMVIGMALGANMDKKAQKEGRQLDLEIKQ